jgi:LacI family transcriptional regulator/LacI family purine nucleotide synthesis repressor
MLAFFSYHVLNATKRKRGNVMSSVSMKDISIACGVSIATVSKALHNHSDIGEETKSKIKRVAKEMGYYPNSQARALKTNRTGNLGVLFMDEAKSGLTHDYFAYVLDSFKRCVEAQGYDITFINSSRKQMTYLEHCRYRGFDGVMIACVDFTDPQVKELVKSNIPLVTVDHSFPNRIAIISDNRKGMKDLLYYVYSQGHRRIAYIHGADSSVTAARLASFYETAKELGLHIPDNYVMLGEYRNTEESGEATEKLMELEEPPTCILYPDDYAAYGGISVLNRLEIMIPEDISIAGYDGIMAGRHMQPMLTTIKQNTEAIGQKAGEKLIELIARPKMSVSKHIIIKGELYQGTTVKNIRNVQ